MKRSKPTHYLSEHHNDNNKENISKFFVQTKPSLTKTKCSANKTQNTEITRPNTKIHGQNNFCRPSEESLDSYVNANNVKRNDQIMKENITSTTNRLVKSSNINTKTNIENSNEQACTRNLCTINQISLELRQKADYIKENYRIIEVNKTSTTNIDDSKEQTIIRNLFSNKQRKLNDEIEPDLNGNDKEITILDSNKQENDGLKYRNSIENYIKVSKLRKSLGKNIKKTCHTIKNRLSSSPMKPANHSPNEDARNKFTENDLILKSYRKSRRDIHSSLENLLLINNDSTHLTNSRSRENQSSEGMEKAFSKFKRGISPIVSKMKRKSSKEALIEEDLILKSYRKSRRDIHSSLEKKAFSKFKRGISPIVSKMKRKSSKEAIINNLESEINGDNLIGDLNENNRQCLLKYNNIGNLPKNLQIDQIQKNNVVKNENGLNKEILSDSTRNEQLFNAEQKRPDRKRRSRSIEKVIGKIKRCLSPASKKMKTDQSGEENNTNLHLKTNNSKMYVTSHDYVPSLKKCIVNCKEVKDSNQTVATDDKIINQKSKENSQKFNQHLYEYLENEMKN